MKYGKDIGTKFYEDGRARRYPGNTVVADVTPGCSAYKVMVHLGRMVSDADLLDHYILLPSDSYHMTVIRGLNDQVRTDEFWPKALPKNAPMEIVDDYVSEAISRAGLPGPVRMKFDTVSINASCAVANLIPADDEQNRMIRDFRDRAAAEIGLFLPKHDTYKFHISLAYTRIVPEAERVEALRTEMDRYISEQSEFITTAPYMAYYNDMLAFSKIRLPRS